MDSSREDDIVFLFKSREESVIKLFSLHLYVPSLPAAIPLFRYMLVAPHIIKCVSEGEQESSKNYSRVSVAVDSWNDLSH